MNKHPRAVEALSLHHWICSQLSELSIDNNTRNRVCAACYAISHEHHRSALTLLLTSPPAVASAYALIRPQFEAYARGMWLRHCATDTEVVRFRDTGKLPTTKSMMEALAKTEAFEAVELSNTYDNHWSFMCAYVHTGVQQVSRWSEGEMISPNYSDEEIKEVVHFSEKVSVFAGLAVATLGKHNEVALRIAERVLELRANAA